MKKSLRVLFAVAALGLFARAASASPIAIFTAPSMTYQNGGNNPCLFGGNGGGGCNSGPANFPAWTTDTGGGSAFVPNPLMNNIGDQPGELLAFATDIGRDFILGFDVNDTSQAQTLSNLTINFFNAASVNIGSYTFAPATPTPDIQNGGGWADYILAAGCNDVGGAVGTGISATCTNYKPFMAPAGTRDINFTFGLTGANDGPDRIFVISKLGANGQPTPFDVDPTPVPEPASLALLGSGLIGAGIRRWRNRRTAA